MKFRADLIWVVTDVETAIEFEAKDLNDAFNFLQKLKWNQMAPRPFSIPQSNKRIRSIKKIPTDGWRFGPASQLAPLIKRISEDRSN